MTFRYLPLCLAFALLVVGCNKSTEVEMAPMGDAAPAFGGGENSTLQKFIVGKWCAVGMNGANPDSYYEFKADGTMSCGGGKDKAWSSTGKWQAGADNVALEYSTMNGKPYEDFRAEYKKAEETGAQIAVARALLFDGVYDGLDKMRNVWVDSDKKHLSFSAPQPPVDTNNPDFGALADALKKGMLRLERMSPKKN